MTMVPVGVRALVVVTALSSLTLAEEPRGPAVWVAPLGSVVMGVGGYGGYGSAGVGLPLGTRSELALGVSVVDADWYGCHTRSVGAWLEAGVSFSSRPRSGWFVQPTLVARGFTTSGGEATGGFWFGCSVSDVDELQGNELDLRVGLQAGYQLRRGRFFVTPFIGASAGFCFNCVPWAFEIFSSPRRRNGASWAVNLDLVRIGWIF